MSERLEAVAELISMCGEEASAKALASALSGLTKAIEERDKARAALEDIRMERSHGATANSDFINRRIAEGLGEEHA